MNYNSTTNFARFLRHCMFSSTFNYVHEFFSYKNHKKRKRRKINFILSLDNNNFYCSRTTSIINELIDFKLLNQCPLIAIKPIKIL